MSEIANLSVADQVWNRAAMEFGGVTPRAGDIALASLLLFHNQAMNGGVTHALESLTSQELAAGIQGYVYFGFPEVAAMLARHDLCAEPEDSLDGEYASLVSSDDVLSRAFENVFRLSPDVFSPLVTARV